MQPRFVPNFTSKDNIKMFDYPCFRYMQNHNIINHNHVIYDNPKIIVEYSFNLSFKKFLQISKMINETHCTKVYNWLALTMTRVKTTYYKLSKVL